jgi:hypothetical protein
MKAASDKHASANRTLKMTRVYGTGKPPIKSAALRQSQKRSRGRRGKLHPYLWNPMFCERAEPKAKAMYTEQEADELSAEVRDMSRVAIEQVHTLAELMAQLQPPPPPAVATTAPPRRVNFKEREPWEVT